MEDCGRWVKINGALGICGAVLNLLLLASPFLLPDVSTVVLTVPCLIVLPVLIVSWTAMGITGAVRKRKSEAAQTEE